MSTVLNEESHQEAGEGVKDFADDIEYLIAFSSKPQTYDDIENHFEQDETYFESDLDHIKEALDYLEDEERIKKDVRLDLEEPVRAYSVRDYDLT
mgnify:CR=1 FL=1